MRHSTSWRNTCLDELIREDCLTKAFVGKLYSLGIGGRALCPNRLKNKTSQSWHAVCLCYVT